MNELSLLDIRIKTGRQKPDVELECFVSQFCK